MNITDPLACPGRDCPRCTRDARDARALRTTAAQADVVMRGHVLAAQSSMIEAYAGNDEAPAWAAAWLRRAVEARARRDWLNARAENLEENGGC